MNFEFVDPTTQQSIFYTSSYIFFIPRTGIYILTNWSKYTLLLLLSSHIYTVLSIIIYNKRMNCAIDRKNWKKILIIKRWIYIYIIYNIGKERQL